MLQLELIALVDGLLLDWVVLEDERDSLLELLLLVLAELAELLFVELLELDEAFATALELDELAD